MAMLYAYVLGFTAAWVFNLIATQRYGGLLAFFVSLGAGFGIYTWFRVMRWQAMESVLTLKATLGLYHQLAFSDHLWIFLLGALTVLIWALAFEGGISWLRKTRILPYRKGPGFARAAARKPGISAALMGSSTSNFAYEALDIRTTALIQLGVYAFPRMDRKTLAGMERFFRLGDGQRYHAMLSIAANPRTPALKKIIRPYQNAINGNQASARLMYKDLREMANSLGHTDAPTRNRLAEIGRELNLSPQDMG